MCGSRRNENHDSFFKSFGVKKIIQFAVTTNKLTNNFADLVTSGLGSDVACGPPVGSH
jgi:hypothetical protein